jgi:P27 family predicted phage terminase small subunit
MARGRKPTASAIHEKNGAYEKNPDRKNHAEPQAIAGAPEMPITVSLDEIAAAKWNETCEFLKQMGILSKSDVVLLEQFCVTYSLYYLTLQKVRQIGVVLVQKDDDGVKLKRNQFTTELQRLMDRLQKLVSELGLSPSSRSRLTASITNDEDDEFSQWLRRGGLN